MSTARLQAIGGSSGGATSTTSSNLNTAELYRNAKDLAQQQIDADKAKMEAAFGYRTKETDQKYGWERNIQGDKLASDRSINTYNTDADKWKTQYSVDASERMQVRGFGQEKDMANLSSTLRMREGEQQYNYQMNLQQDNNAAKRALADDAQEHDRGMFNLRDESDSRRTTAAYNRARSAFRGKY